VVSPGTGADEERVSESADNPATVATDVGTGAAVGLAAAFKNVLSGEFTVCNNGTVGHIDAVTIRKRGAGRNSPTTSTLALVSDVADGPALRISIPEIIGGRHGGQKTGRTGWNSKPFCITGYGVLRVDLSAAHLFKAGDVVVIPRGLLLGIPRDGIVIVDVVDEVVYFQLDHDRKRMYRCREE